MPATNAPPSTTNIDPVTNAAESQTRYSIAVVVSVTSPTRPTGCSEFVLAKNSSACSGVHPRAF